MHRTAFHRGQRHPLAPAALLLLALCLLAAGAQAANETANTSVPVADDGRTIDGIVLLPTVATAQPTPTLCAYADAYPMPNFTADRTSGPAPLTVRFTDTSSEWAYEWHWDFGDGATSTEENPVHTFASPGVYQVSLTIRENDHIDGCVLVHMWYDPNFALSTKRVNVTVVGTGPIPFKPLAIPGRIQAEDYDLGGEGVAYHDTTAGNSGGAYRQDGVDIETAGGVTNIGWIRTGEWLTYTSTVAQAGQYTMTASVASPNSGRTIALSVDGVQSATVQVPNTGSFEAFRTVDVPVTLAAGTHTLKLMFSGDGQNLDWIAFAAPPTTPEPYVNVTIPCTIEAENYDLGGEGVAYHDTTAGNSGGAYRQDDVDVAAITDGHAVVGIENGEYLTYTIDVSPTGSGLAALVLHLASDHDGGSVQLEVNGRVAGNVSVPNTGSATVFRPVQTQVVPAKGTLRLLFRGGGMSMDRIESPWTMIRPERFPSPNFTADRTNGTAPLTVRFTDTSSEFAYDWHWTFGDGAISTEQNPVHTFLSPGVYSVNLTIDEHDHWEGSALVHYWPPPTPWPKTVNVTVEGPGPNPGLAIPGRIQAEDYNAGGEGVAFHDTTPGNQGGAYRSDDVDVAAITDGHAVVGIEDGEWLVYTIGGVAPTPQLPALVLYLGSDRDGGSVQLEVNGRVAGTVSVPNTGSATAFRAVQTQVQAAAGTLRLRFHGAGMGMDRIESPQFTSTGDNYNWANFTADPVNGTAPLRVRFTDTSSEFAYQWLWDFGDGATSAEQNPVHTYPSPGIYNVSLNIREADHWSFGGFMHIWNDLSHGKTVQVTVEGTGPALGHAIPGTIEAEDYDAGGEGVAYHDTTASNTGGAYRHDDVDIETAGGTTNVGWIREGEWLTYTADVASAGQYTLTARVASPNSGRTILVLVDDRSVATIAVPRTGSFSTWQTASVQVPLAAGQHTLRLMFTGDGQNIDWIAFGMGPTPPTTTTTTPVPSGGASFTAAPLTASHGSAVKFTVTPASGKSISAAWWSFDAPAHLNTWNSRATNPTFFYPSAGTFSPLVKLTYTDGSTETVQRTNYVRAT